ncbi:uncharacterized protein LOC130297252 isoform X3 [Hyla sarda]|uniref:uncharacterized protein LOC130297252 isoform X3 n=1 Tax=Hyla sarda TaxID=327740 RepID=UPI0024C2FA60|nr:uncharacterized protein LOC130297252 isoform X3 [Hyla sarda]
MTRITGSKITYSGCLATGHGWWLEPRLTPRETAAKAGEGYHGAEQDGHGSLSSPAISPTLLDAMIAGDWSGDHVSNSMKMPSRDKHRGTNTDGVWTAHFTPRKTGNSIITAGRGTSIALFVNKLPTPPCSSAGRFTQVFTGRDYSRTSLIRLLLEERNNVSGGFWT